MNLTLQKTLFYKSSFWNIAFLPASIMAPLGLFAHRVCILACVLVFCMAPVRYVALKVEVRVVPLQAAARALFHIWTVGELQSLALKYGSPHPCVRWGVGGSRRHSRKTPFQWWRLGLALFALVLLRHWTSTPSAQEGWDLGRGMGKEEINWCLEWAGEPSGVLKQSKGWWGWWEELKGGAGTRGAGAGDVVMRGAADNALVPPKPWGCCLLPSLCPGLHEEQGVPGYPSVLRFVLKNLGHLL